MEVMIETCCGIDVHQKSVVCCILDGPLESNKPKKIQKKFGTTTIALQNALDWLLENHVTGMTFFTLYLASLGDTMTKLMTYVPFSFMRAVFTSGQQFFSLREALVLFAWTLVLLLFAPTIYEKRAFV